MSKTIDRKLLTEAELRAKVRAKEARLHPHSKAAVLNARNAMQAYWTVHSQRKLAPA